MSSRSLLQYWRTLDFPGTCKQWEAELIYILKDLFFLQKNRLWHSKEREVKKWSKKLFYWGSYRRDLWQTSWVEKIANHEWLISKWKYASKVLFLIPCSYTRKSVWRKRNRDSLRPRLQNANLVVAKSLDRRLTIRRTRAVSNSRRIEQCNREYRLIVQVLHGARKIFRSRITKNNFLNSRFRENKIG